MYQFSKSDLYQITSSDDTSATPRAIVNQISRDFARVLTLPEVKDQLASLGFTPLPTTPEEYDRINREQIAMIAGFLKAAGL